MTQILFQDRAGCVTLYLHDSSGAPVTGLTYSTLAVDYRLGTSPFASKVLATAASATIGSGVNGTVALTAVDPGVSGNSISVEVVVPSGTSPLLISYTSNVVTVSLSVASGVPVTADNTALKVADAINAALIDVTAAAQGTGADSLSIPQTITALSGGVDYLTDLGDGFYSVGFSPTELSATGSMLIKAKGANTTVTVVDAYVSTPLADSPSAPISSPPATSTLFGWVYDVTGQPVEGASVSFRVLDTPSIVGNCVAGAGLASDIRSVSTDSNGFFSMNLVVGASVDVFIPAANFRRIVTVPSGSVNVFDIP